VPANPETKPVPRDSTKYRLQVAAAHREPGRQEAEAPMRRTLTSAAMAIALAAVVVAPALASTETRTVVGPRNTVVCVITYTESSGNTRVDTWKELFSITGVSCSVTKNP
jgi:hypothetical protein